MDASSVFSKHAISCEQTGQKVINTSGLHGMLRELQLDVDLDYAAAVLKKYDANSNGTLDKAEFESIVADALYVGKLATAPPTDVDPIVLTAFRKHDANVSGTLEAAELHGVLKELHVDVDSVHTRAVLKRYDADSSGSLSLVELDTLYKDVLYAGGLAVPPSADVDPAVISAFRRHDADGSGDVSVRELHSLLRELGVDEDAPHTAKMLAAYDTDADGTLSLSELSTLFADLMTGGVAVRGAAVPEAVRAAFRKHDADGSGEIDAAELRNALQSAGLEVDEAKAQSLLLSGTGSEQGTLNLAQFADIIHELSF